MDIGWFLPEAIANMAEKVDSLFVIISWVALAMFILVEMLLFIFLIRYRRRRSDDQGQSIHGNTKIEIIWTIIPAIILVIIGILGSQITYDIQRPPKDVYTIEVVGKKWVWDFKYPEGFKTTNELRVPEGKNILFKISSNDVIHSFWIPALRMKQDAVPGRETQFWTGPLKKGTYALPCAEYCGTMHSMMLGKLTVVSQDEYSQFVKSGGKIALTSSSTESPAEKGKALAQSKGCLTCHAVDSSKMFGPGWGGVYGKQIQLADGSTVKYDDDYIIESIMKPDAKIPAGYTAPMPPQNITEDEARSIAEYMKTLK